MTLLKNIYIYFLIFLKKYKKPSESASDFDEYDHSYNNNKDRNQRKKKIHYQCSSKKRILNLYWN